MSVSHTNQPSAAQPAPAILSIQSHVAYGYAGNRAAVFPLQRMGYDVTAVHTVQFSNHTGYGAWEGDVFDSDHLRRVLKGIADRGFFENCAGLLTGYLGSPAIGEIILDTLEKLPPHCPWICDPVMGDVGRGFYVREQIPEFFKSEALSRAHLITPNLFELEYLSGATIRTIADARTACREIHNGPASASKEQQGPELILVTSLITEDTPAHSISMLLSCRNGECYMVTTPRLEMEFPSYAGSGDMTSAIFTGCLLRGQDYASALSHTAAALYGVFKTSFDIGGREIALIAAQDHITTPQQFFPVVKL